MGSSCFLLNKLDEGREGGEVHVKKKKQSAKAKKIVLRRDGINTTIFTKVVKKIFLACHGSHIEEQFFLSPLWITNGPSLGGTPLSDFQRKEGSVLSNFVSFLLGRIHNLICLR